MKRRPDIFHWSLLFVAAIFTVLAFVGCKPTEYATQKQINKAEYYHPDLLLKWCADKVPVKVDSTIETEYTAGDTEQGFLTINCDTVRITDSFTKERIITLTYDKLRVDTVREKTIVTKENKAALVLEQSKNKKLETNGTIQTQKLKNKNRIIVALSAFSLLLIILLWIAWRTKIRRRVSM